VVERSIRPPGRDHLAAARIAWPSGCSRSRTSPAVQHRRRRLYGRNPRPSFDVVHLGT
jgi:hypothetical protein